MRDFREFEAANEDEFKHQRHQTSQISESVTPIENYPRKLRIYPRVVGLCNIPTASNRDVSSVSEAPAKFDPSSTNALPTSNRDPIEPSYSQLLQDATQTTLMFIELQRWHEMQSKATK